MFDIREDGEGGPSKLAQMMQNPGVFISVKPKAKQTSKVSVIQIYICAIFHETPLKIIK